MKLNRSNKIILWVLCLLFIAPGLSAYLFYMNPQWLQGKTINKGHFVQPVEQLAIFSNSAKWRIVLWSANGCDKTCFTRLDELARMRLALGRRLYQVELWLIMGEHAPQLSKAEQQQIHNYNIESKMIALPPKAFAHHNLTTFIVTPSNDLILQYSAQSPLKDIFHDMKHLLTSSEAST